MRGMDGWRLAEMLAEVSGLIVSPGELYGEPGARSCASRSSSPTNGWNSWLTSLETRARSQYDRPMVDLENRINAWHEQIATITPENLETRRDVELVIAKLDEGQLRVAEVAAVVWWSCTNG